MMPEPEPIRKPIDKWIPWMFVAFFVGLAVISAGFVTTAFKTHRGVVTDHAYQKGLNYNQTIALAEAQAASGIQGIIHLKDGILQFELMNADGERIPDAAVTTVIKRVTDDGQDFTVALAEREAGLYVSSVTFPAPGLWNVGVKAHWTDGQYQQMKRLVVK